MESLACLFCGERILPLHDETTACPRCGVTVTITADLSDVKSLMAPMVFDTNPPTKEQRRRLKVLIEPADASPDDVYLVVAWDPEEMLTTMEVAQTIRIERNSVNHLVRRGIFPGAARAEPTLKEYTHGRWLIPRRDVWERLRRGRRSDGT
jgi:hypothetical protein